ncbi:phytoene desaturase family protein [Microbacterium dauci]|uniref:NAD(P)/FAD-dependent oxidoreductase n=1 Tax=Microbacterium dauci TaxID=3048008 RepID=A0ABT6ZA02_9MICO|nr:NAD(P)/FAD-dependent oxidoreductase [Microbacterium sp. LX3-4]MDJ1112991.1 NAD(P)/FAD-dependent oxidoreductase [Microbacterium sp. LX3-4]
MRDAVVVGSGPNGLAAAVTLARAGLSVLLIEAAPQLGGGTRTDELTLPGYRHDICSAVHPLAFESPFFRAFGLTDRVPFVVPEASYAQPLDDGPAAIAYRDLERTADTLRGDGARYARLLAPLAARAAEVAETTGGSLVRMPRHPLTAARLAAATLDQGGPWWDRGFSAEAAPALLAGVAAHAILPMPGLAAAGAGLVLGAYGHARGWPIPVGGSQRIADALEADLRAHGGEIVTGTTIRSLDELPPSRAVLLDIAPPALLRMAGDRLPAAYRRALARFRFGGAVAKVDFALSAPVPWRDPAVAEAGTVHLGGTRAEIAASERAVARGEVPANPYVLVSQPSLFDDTRAPTGAHTLWAYTHVPAGSGVDRTEAVTAQIERFAPGFRDVVVAHASRTAVQVASHNPNYIDGDIAAGAPSLRQLLRRPTLSPEPWRTPLPGVYLSSASTSPGPGVHGLAGWHAARSALRREFGITTMPDLSPV